MTRSRLGDALVSHPLPPGQFSILGQTFARGTQTVTEPEPRAPRTKAATGRPQARRNQEASAAGVAGRGALSGRSPRRGRRRGLGTGPRRRVQPSGAARPQGPSSLTRPLGLVTRKEPSRASPRANDASGAGRGRDGRPGPEPPEVMQMGT